mmetsp:Transcript_115325/g.229853  ORF Transcript_115325/g.229853 Transcript_115325/m.229853 type:complete len:215 (+) Transcript_115325:537-1181(+)
MLVPTTAELLPDRLSDRNGREPPCVCGLAARLPSTETLCPLDPGSSSRAEEGNGSCFSVRLEPFGDEAIIRGHEDRGVMRTLSFGPSLLLRDEARPPLPTALLPLPVLVLTPACVSSAGAVEVPAWSETMSCGTVAVREPTASAEGGTISTLLPERGDDDATGAVRRQGAIAMVLLALRWQHRRGGGLCGLRFGLLVERQRLLRVGCISPRTLG